MPRRSAPVPRFTEFREGMGDDILRKMAYFNDRYNQLTQRQAELAEAGNAPSRLKAELQAALSVDPLLDVDQWAKDLRPADHERFSVRWARSLAVPALAAAANELRTGSLVDPRRYWGHLLVVQSGVMLNNRNGAVPATPGQHFEGLIVTAAAEPDELGHIRLNDTESRTPVGLTGLLNPEDFTARVQLAVFSRPDAPAPVEPH